MRARVIVGREGALDMQGLGKDRVVSWHPRAARVLGGGGGPPSCLVARAGIRCSGLTLPPAPRLSPLQTGGELLRGRGRAGSQMLDSLSRVGRRWGFQAKTVNTHVLLKQWRKQGQTLFQGEEWIQVKRIARMRHGGPRHA